MYESIIIAALLFIVYSMVKHNCDYIDSLHVDVAKLQDEVSAIKTQMEEQVQQQTRFSRGGMMPGTR